MGGAVSSLSPLALWDWLRGRPDIRVVLLGLDNAGKSSILSLAATGKVKETVPTIGFDLSQVTHNGLQINMWDLGGQSTIRQYWRCYYADTAAVIFVIDSADTDRMELVHEELLRLLDEDELKDTPLLVLANKQDCSDALSPEDISLRLHLNKLKDRDWAIFGTSVRSDPPVGIVDALDWLTKILKSY